jgi:hypothetical protein
MVSTLRRSKGVALIIVLTMLAVLALLGVSMLVLSTADRTVSMNYLDQVRAGRLARSGVAAAVAALSHDPFSDNLRYWGDDENEAGNSNDGAVELDFAKNPSLAIELDGDPVSAPSTTVKYTVDVPGGTPKTFGVSGYHSSSTYGLNTDVYQVRIQESSGCLHLNDGARLYGGNNSSVSQNLKRMLNVLGGLPTVGVANLGDRILAVRPPGGFGSITELEKHLSPAEMRRIRPFVATHSWVDKNVANPVPLSTGVVQQYPVRYFRGEDPGQFRRGRGKSASGSPSKGSLRWFDSGSTDKNHCAIYGLDELNPSYIEIVQRAPVNINSARREVLVTLLADLQGFFVGERRSFAPYCPSPEPGIQGSVSTPQRYYSWWTNTQTYDDQDEDGDEYGFLYPTQKIAAPAGSGTGTTTASTVSADVIAEHIIACRDRGSLGGVNYKEAWFGGPFRTWTQFNRFVDNLVEAGVIRDNRQIFFDYNGGEWSTLNPVPSIAAQKFASYAIADVLKANFNPNLHLNELNPDANLFQRVDKTDLIVNSTEFTFRATGVYEIESLGRVLRPLAGNRTQSGPLQCKIEAERRVCAAVRVFEPYRETSQRHFQPGRIPEKDSDDRTSSGTALEIGPEPGVGQRTYDDTFGGYSVQTSFGQDGYRGYSNKTASRTTGWGYEWDGYIALSTYGGTEKKSGTESCQPHWPVEAASEYEGMHVHFESGFDANQNSGLEAHELACGRSNTSGVKARNHSDRADDPAGPLWTGNGVKGAHRLARSFRLPAWNAVAKAPLLPAFAPGDLRTDGFYSERNCGAAYFMRQASSVVGNDNPLISGNFALHGGVISLWIKPSFFPEHTGKARNIVSMAKHHEVTGYRDPSPFNLMFLPAHDLPAYSEPQADEIARWSRPGPETPKGGPLAPACDYRDPFSPMYDGNIPVASSKTPTEHRGQGLGVWQFRPSSFMAYRAATTADAGFVGGAGGILPELVDLENYAVTSCLNHNLHPHGLDTGSTPNPKADPKEMRPNYFEAHRWTHVMLSWQALPPW